MAPQPPRSRQTRRQRADVFFALYATLPRRSIDALAATAHGLGLRVSRGTLDRYSSDYGWQARLADFEEERAAVEGSPAGVVVKMNERQAQLGRAAQELARKAFNSIGKQADAIGPHEAIRLAKDGQHIERLAMGEATSRHEIAVSVYNELVESIAILFEDASRLDDRDAMRRRFAVGVDALIAAHMEGLPLDARIVSDEADAED